MHIKEAQDKIMVTSVTLGNFFTTSSGKTVLGGVGGSGLDTQSLLKSLTEAKRAPIVRNEDLIKTNSDKSGKLTEYQSLLNSFKASLDALRNPPGVGNAADNVFKFRIGDVPPNASQYVDISTAAGAAIQSYEIRDIETVATVARQGTGSFAVASADADVVGIGGVNFAPGVIEFRGEEIVVEDTDSLNKIAAKFNAVSSATNVTATVINVGPNNFRLSFIATSTGTDGNFDLADAVDPNDVLDNIGLTAAEDATNAVFKLNGIQIERQSNTVSDVISGVTFNILQPTPDALTPYVVSVKPDTESVQNVINRFVQDYNAIKAFEAKQTKLESDGTFSKDALLASNQTFLNITNQINAMVNTRVSGLANNAPSSLVDIGLSFIAVPGDDETPDFANALTVNDGQLTAALNSNFDAVARLFGFNVTSTDPNLAVFNRTNGLSVTTFDLEIKPGTNIFKATYTVGGEETTVNLTATALSGGADGYSLKGPQGSAIEGLEMIYASTANSDVTINVSQGVADRLYNAVNAATTTDTGGIALELTAITENTDRLNKDIENINQQVEEFQQTLLARFTALEQAISRVNSLLQSLDANSAARQIASNS